MASGSSGSSLASDVFMARRKRGREFFAMLLIFGCVSGFWLCPIWY